MAEIETQHLKYSESQARDDHGRFGQGESSSAKGNRLRKEALAATAAATRSGTSAAHDKAAAAHQAAADHYSHQAYAVSDRHSQTASDHSATANALRSQGKSVKGELTTRGRNRLAGDDFAGPNRTYPIHDISHARNALARASQQRKAGKLSDAQYNSIVAKVERRYPSIGKDDGKSWSPSSGLWQPVLRLKGLVTGLPSLSSALGYDVKAAVRTEIKVKEEGGKRVVEAYANTFNHRDKEGDVTVKGAFAETVREFRAGGQIKALRNHNRDSVVGVPDHIEEDSTGLLTVTRFGKSQVANDTFADISDGIITHLSIGYMLRPGGTEVGAFKGERSRFLKSLRLPEYSFVTFPVDDQAAVVGVKSLDELSQLLWQLPRAITWLCSPEAYAELAEETVFQAIEMFEDAADQLRVVVGLPTDDDEGIDPETGEPHDEPEPAGDGEVSAEDLAKLTEAINKLGGMRAPSLSY